MKGYIHIGVTVVSRELKKINYKYTNLMRLTYPSLGMFYNNNTEQVSIFMREIRNIILSVPFLVKFKWISPYPRMILGCKISPYRIQLRTCGK